MNFSAEAGSASNSLSTIGTGGGTNLTIQQIQPALAVRGASCIMCHANINANVISDFGSSDSFYLDQDKNLGSTFDPNALSSYFYNPISWQTLQSVSGQVIVPNVAVPAQVATNAGAGTTPISLLSFLTDNELPDFSQSFLSYFNFAAIPTHLSLTNAVIAPAGSASVTAMNTIYIGAPTAAQISALAPGQSTGAVAVNGTSLTPATGLGVVAGTSNSYVSNVGAVQCAGKDIVINGTLLLDNLQVFAGGGGCRLYVTGAVFIEGPITYLNNGVTDSSANLQISSAEAIIMGVGLNGLSYSAGSPGQMDDPEPGRDPLQTRLLNDSRNLELRIAPSISAYLNWAQGVYHEGANIGAQLLVDASVVTGSSQTSTSPSGQIRTSINYSGLLLNAPVVHSRYLGDFKGVIIAEAAEFSLGQFSFSFDPVFNKSSVSILPLLTSQYDILCASQTPASCNPINP